MEVLETHPEQTELETQSVERHLGELSLYEAPAVVQDHASWNRNVQPYYGE